MAKFLDTRDSPRVSPTRGIGIAAGQAGARPPIAEATASAPADPVQPVSVLPLWRHPTARWIVIHHRADDGARVRLGCRRLGFEVHWPREVARVPRRDDVLRPYFPGYMFALPDVPSASWHALGRVPNVIGIVGARETGSPIHPPPGLVLDLINRAGGAIDGVIPAREDAIASKKRQHFEHDDPLRIADYGTWTGWDAVFQYRDSKDRIVVLVEIFGRATKLMLPDSAVRPRPKERV